MGQRDAPKACCAIGAIRFVGGDLSRRTAVIGTTEVASAIITLEAVINVAYSGVGRWNDSLPPGRVGWERVIAAFGAAIEAEKARCDG